MRSLKKIVLPNSNLYLLGSGNDTNGNKIIRLKFFNSNRGFSIQTTGNLKQTGTILRGLKTISDMQTLTSSQLNTISKEVRNYIKSYGSKTQKEKLKE